MKVRAGTRVRRIEGDFNGTVKGGEYILSSIDTDGIRLKGLTPCYDEACFEIIPDEHELVLASQCAKEYTTRINALKAELEELNEKFVLAVEVMTKYGVKLI